MRIKHEDTPCLGPSTETLESVQELTALMYALEPDSVVPVPPAFFDGVFDGPPPEDPEHMVLWESGALAAELMQLGGQA